MSKGKVLAKKAQKKVESSEDSDDSSEEAPVVTKKAQKQAPVVSKKAAKKPVVESSDDSSSEEEKVTPSALANKKLFVKPKEGSGRLDTANKSSKVQVKYLEKKAEASDSDDSSDDEVVLGKKAAPVVSKKAAKKQESSDDSDSSEAPVPQKKLKTVEPVRKASNGKKVAAPVVAKKAAAKKQESSDDSDDSDDTPVVSTKKVVAPVKKAKAKVQESSDDVDSSEEKVAPKKAAVAKKAIRKESNASAQRKVSAVAEKKASLVGKAKVTKKAVVEESSDEESSEEAPVVTKKAMAAPAKVAKKAVVEESSDEESSEEAAPVKPTKKAAKKAAKQESSDEESSEEAPVEKSRKKSSVKIQNELEEKVRKDSGNLANLVDEPKKAVHDDSGFDKNNNEVIVKGLPFAATEDDIEAFFKEAGEIVKVNLLKGYDGSSKGCAFVTFAENSAVVESASWSGSDFGGRKVFIEQTKPKEQRDFGQGRDMNPRTPRADGGGEGEPRRHTNESETIFCGNLNFNTDVDKLWEFFEPCGSVKDVRMGKGPDGSSRGFAHVEFENQDAATKALGFNLRKLDGRALNVGPCTPSKKLFKSNN